MRDYINLGPTPCDEPCAQAGRDPMQERKEIRAYVRQLKRKFGPLPAGVEIKSHYFYTGGGYTEVVVEFDPDVREQLEAALNIEHNLPAKWDLFATVEMTAGIVPIPTASGEWVYR